MTPPVLNIHVENARVHGGRRVCINPLWCNWPTIFCKTIDYYRLLNPTLSGIILPPNLGHVRPMPMVIRLLHGRFLNHVSQEKQHRIVMDALTYQDEMLRCGPRLPRKPRSNEPRPKSIWVGCLQIIQIVDEHFGTEPMVAWGSKILELPKYPKS